MDDISIDIEGLMIEFNLFLRTSKLCMVLCQNVMEPSRFLTGRHSLFSELIEFGWSAACVHRVF